jgi:hypothetical protein
MSADEPTAPPLKLSRILTTAGPTSGSTWSSIFFGRMSPIKRLASSSKSLLKKVVWQALERQGGASQ